MDYANSSERLQQLVDEALAIRQSMSHHDIASPSRRETPVANDPSRAILTPLPASNGNPFSSSNPFHSSPSPGPRPEVSSQPVPSPFASPAPFLTVAVPPARNVVFTATNDDASRFVAQMNRALYLHSDAFSPSDPRRAVFWVAQHFGARRRTGFKDWRTRIPRSCSRDRTYNSPCSPLFPPPDLEFRAAIDLRRLSQTGSASEYSSAFSTLANRAGGADTSLLHAWFVDGLKPAVRQAVQLQASVVAQTNPAAAWRTLEQFSSAAEQHEAQQRPSGSARHVPPTVGPRPAKPISSYAAAVNHPRTNPFLLSASSPVDISPVHISPVHISPVDLSPFDISAASVRPPPPLVVSGSFLRRRLLTGSSGVCASCVGRRVIPRRRVQ